MSKKSHPFYWIIGLPIGVGLYLYDDILWGPIPIAAANYWLGWPKGLFWLAFAYFVASFIACYFILRHFEQHPSKSRPANWLKSKRGEHRSVVYGLLLAGRWLGLAVSCFVFGAILTAIPVGKFRLFPEVGKLTLSTIMSSLFVFLFLGFYGGLFTFLVEAGVWKTLVLVLGLGVVVRILFKIQSQT